MVENAWLVLEPPPIVQFLMLREIFKLKLILLIRSGACVDAVGSSREGHEIWPSIYAFPTVEER